MRLIHTAARSLHYWNLPINRTFSYRLEHSVGKREWIFHGYSRAGTTPGTGTVTLRVANACDAGGSATVKFLQINNCGFAIVATPNPSDGNVNISAAQPQGAATTADINQSKLYQIKIFDQSGNIKGVYNYSGGVTNINIDISSLVAGVYTIQAYNGIEYATKQIVKQ